MSAASAEPASVTESGADFLARVNPVRRVVRTQLVLDNAALEAWKELQQELTAQKLKDAQSARLAGGKESAAVKKIKAKIEVSEKELEGKQGWFTLRAMPAHEYQAMKDANPPRPDNQLDLVNGYNREAVGAAMVHRCLINPVFKDCEKPGCTHDPDNGDACGTFDQLRVSLNPTEWQELVDAAQDANGAVKNAPKSLPASSPRSRLASGSPRPSDAE